MHFIEPESIYIPEDRIRREFDPQVIQELKQSILSKGLLNPITLREYTGTENYFRTIVAGETRLRAIMELIKDGRAFTCNSEVVPVGKVPYLLLCELEPALALEAELEENVLRRSLTWQEEAAARRRLHDLRKQQAPNPAAYTEMDTAKELIARGVEAYPQPVVQDLLIGRFLTNPKVSEAKTKKDAFKEAKKLIEKELIDSLAGSVEAIHASMTLIQGDSAVEVPKLPANTFDLILTDPPYGINVEKSGGMIANTHHYTDSPETLEKILDWAPEQLYRVARPMAHLYWFCDIAWFPEISLALKDAGWQVWRVPIIWDKKGVGVVPDERKWPRRSYEAIIYAIKGNMPVLRVANDVINFAPVRTQGSAEKPKEVLHELITRSVTHGANILDPFCGSGSIFLAARDYKCSATGIEVNPEIAKVAKARTNDVAALL